MIGWLAGGILKIIMQSVIGAPNLIIYTLEIISTGERDCGFAFKCILANGIRVLCKGIRHFDKKMDIL